MADDEVAFAVVAYRDDGVWELAEVSLDVGESLELLVTALKRFPSDVGVLGFVTLGEDDFVIARATGGEVRLFLSDLAAADDWPLAADILDELDASEADDGGDEAVPVGDSRILSDLGLSKKDLFRLLDDDDAYSTDVLVDIAEQLGFGDEFEALVG